MPLYEYRCSDCRNIFSELIGINQIDSGIDCPACNCKETVRLFSSFSLGGGSEKKTVCIPSNTRFT